LAIRHTVAPLATPNRPCSRFWILATCLENRSSGATDQEDVSQCLDFGDMFRIHVAGGNMCLQRVRILRFWRHVANPFDWDSQDGGIAANWCRLRGWYGGGEVGTGARLRWGLEFGKWGRASLGGAGPAGWLRESGSRLPQSKVTEAVTGGRRVGRVRACGEGAWVGPGQRAGSGMGGRGEIGNSE